MSPFLFGIVMTALMRDAVAGLSPGAAEAYKKDDLEDVLFADDTLLIGRVGRHVEEYLAAVEQRGKEYGLQIHWGKVALVPVGAAASMRAPSGEIITPSASMLYLGATIHADGQFEWRALPSTICAKSGRIRL